MPSLPAAPHGPSRRSVLAGAAGAAGAALLTGCTGESGANPEDNGIPLERRMRENAVRDTERLLERYDATTAAHPDLAGRLAPLRAAVAAHHAALAVSGSAPPAGAGAPSASSSGSAPSAGTPAPRSAPVPATAAEALTELADTERSLSEARTIALAGAPGELARLLASVAACGAVHAYLLTSTTPGAAS
ncbi:MULTISPECIES: hypothetical protein [unclassified Streptomyces]|uniref:hypothetical protein n=1 Tax=unclassified Streptomyces TaxID=2593676 RepID=UPI002E305ABB|nr:MULTISPECIES: hypothetical protein [unclassified Streptomyces]WUC68608.1 hypothetical protein OG861_08985 [Streptomyces sp. NBC_00539]